MPFDRYRSIEDMPPPWRDPDDPENLRLVGEMLTLYRQLLGDKFVRRPGIQKFRSVEEMWAAEEDEFRRVPVQKKSDA